MDCRFYEAVKETEDSILNNSLNYCAQNFKEHVGITTSGITVQHENSPFLGQSMN